MGGAARSGTAEIKLEKNVIVENMPAPAPSPALKC